MIILRSPIPKFAVAPPLRERAVVLGSTEQVHRLWGAVHRMSDAVRVSTNFQLVYNGYCTWHFEIGYEVALRRETNSSFLQYKRQSSKRTNGMKIINAGDAFAME